MFTPAISASNIGDEIIYEACNKVIKEIYPDAFYIKVSTHLPLDSWMNQFNDIYLKFVAGSNLLGKQSWRKRSQWNLSISSIPWATSSILMGVGWHRYQKGKTSLFTKYLYRKVLSKNYIHSVRDSYTLNKLKELGFENIINTGCPTMWDLTPEHCRLIPHKKSNTVITTITDYNKDPQKDSQMINTLIRNYKDVYVWLQGYNDYNYLKELNMLTRIKIIYPSLEEYKAFLTKHEYVDFIGTRLHSGIKALQYCKRTIIIGIDNRAKEKGKDFNMPILARENIDELENVLNTEIETAIKLPTENIQKWKNQFIKT